MSKRTLESDLDLAWIKLETSLSTYSCRTEYMPRAVYPHLVRLNPGVHNKPPTAGPMNGFNTFKTVYTQVVDDADGPTAPVTDYFTLPEKDLTPNNAGCLWRPALIAAGLTISDIFPSAKNNHEAAAERPAKKARLGESVAELEASYEALEAKYKKLEAKKLAPLAFVVASPVSCDTFLFDSQDTAKREKVSNVISAFIDGPKDLYRDYKMREADLASVYYLLSWACGEIGEDEIPKELREKVGKAYKEMDPQEEEWNTDSDVLDLPVASLTTIERDK